MRAPPLVYHPRYSCPWPAAHRFPMWKFADLFDVVQRQSWYSPALVHTPTPLPSSAFTAVHQEAYYRAFSAGALDDDAVRRIGFRGEIANPALIERTKLEVAGTVLATKLALRHGIACNCAGGTHHAHRTYGSGFTILNDLAVAAAWARREAGVERVAIIDLDVHQGDGTANILQDEERCFTWSVHCGVNFPFGFSEKHAPHLGKDRSSLDTALARGAGDAEMLDAVALHLPAIMDDFAPTLVLYDAGADAHAVDGLGHLEQTDAGMLARDTAVLRECARRAVPVATVIGGGYDRDRSRLAKRHAAVFHAARAVWREYASRR